jgi:hypothetical protein
VVDAGTGRGELVEKGHQQLSPELVVTVAHAI